MAPSHAPGGPNKMKGNKPALPAPQSMHATALLCSALRCVGPFKENNSASDMTLGLVRLPAFWLPSRDKHDLVIIERYNAELIRWNGVRSNVNLVRKGSLIRQYCCLDPKKLLFWVESQDRSYLNYNACMVPVTKYCSKASYRVTLCGRVGELSSVGLFQYELTPCCLVMSAR